MLLPFYNKKHLLILILPLVQTGAMWVVIFGVICLIYLVERSLTLPRLYPPGPLPLPFVGNLLSVIYKLRKEKYHHKLWQSWTQQYGELLGLRLGILNVVIVSGRDKIKEVSSREVFEGRPDGFFYTMRSFGKKIGLVFSDGPKWSTTRKFVLKYLKNFGYNTRHMEKNIEEECKALVKLRMNDDARPVFVNSMFHVPIVNIMWQLVAGKRYNLDDVRLKHLCDLITRLFKAADMSGGVLNFLPFLRHVIPGLIGYTELQTIHNQIHEFIETALELEITQHLLVALNNVQPRVLFIKETIQEHELSIDVNHHRDIIDAFLIEMKEQNDQPFTKDDLIVVCLDLLEAGMETVSNTAVFMLLHLVRDQEIQIKLQMEIDEVISRDRTPTVNDRNRMVYTEAVILETLRISSVAAVGIPHMALEDARLGNYMIPKGTLILLAMHDLHNGNHWKDPNVFRPERFITKEGNLVQDEWLMPFGSGKRRCIGEGLARSELFMFLTHLLQRFSLRIPEEDPLPSTEPIDGLSLSAKPFRVIFEPRW